MNNFAYLKPECPFYDLFENGHCPIVNIIFPNHAELDGSDEKEVYMVDIKKIEADTLEEIANRIAKKAGANPAIVLNDIKQKGLPLRVSQTSGCSTDVPFFL